MNTQYELVKKRHIKWFTVANVADETFTSETTVKRWIHKGLLKAHKLGRDWKIKPQDLYDFIEKSANF